MLTTWGDTLQALADLGTKMELLAQGETNSPLIDENTTPEELLIATINVLAARCGRAMEIAATNIITQYMTAKHHEA